MSEVAIGSAVSAVAILEAFEEKCATPISKLREISNDMVKEMQKGLESEGGSKLKMLISHVQNLPSGNENGVFYALDLGGTNFRVIRVLLGGNQDRVPKQESRQFVIPQNLTKGNSDELFNFIAEKLATFVATEGVMFHIPEGKKRELGFTFSFPVTQNSLSSGNLIKWTKGFNIKDAVGRDVVEELKKAMKRIGLDMHVTALVNDSVGTLAGGRYKNQDVAIAVILGTGTNAAYVEQVDQIPKWIGSKPKSGEMVINMEWGDFDSNLPLTEFDVSLDSQSVFPGEEKFEKMISGKYLGEILRRVVLKMAKEAAFFGNTIPPKLKNPNIISTLDMSAMHDDKSPDLMIVGNKLKDILEVSETSLELRKVVINLCDIITTRAARLSAAGIYGILKKLGRDVIEKSDTEKITVIAMDGALFEHYTQFSECVRTSLNELLGDEVSRNIEIKHSKDGSGIGAALIAASASH